MSGRGEKNPNWRGGTTVTSNGYRKIKLPGHHLSDVGGYAYEHRVVMEETIGRPLEPWEIVHHIDGDKLNNTPDNLSLLPSRWHHKNLHSKGSNRKAGEDNPTIKCACGCRKSFRKYDGSGRPRRFLPGHWRRGSGKERRFVCCACGCNSEIETPDKYGRERRYVVGHNARHNQGRAHKP